MPEECSGRQTTKREREIALLPEQREMKRNSESTRNDVSDDESSSCRDIFSQCAGSDDLIGIPSMTTEGNVSNRVFPLTARRDPAIGSSSRR